MAEITTNTNESSEDKFDIEKLHSILLMMLKDIRFVCEKHDLSYSLGGGTFLGAVRSKAFIPWDDDADVMMPREDYERFCELFAAEFPEKYVLEDPRKVDCKHIMARVILKGTLYLDRYTECYPGEKGIFIDVFPIDKMPKGKASFRAFRYKLYSIAMATAFMYKFPSEEMRRLSKTDKKIKRYYSFRRFIGFFTSIFFGRRFYMRKVQKLAYYKKQTGFSGVPLSRGYNNEKFEDYVWNEMTEVELEGEKFSGLKNYEAYFKNLYGDDWMIPHSPERRVTHLPVEIDYGIYK